MLNTRSLQDAIDHAFQAGGGSVYVPPGIFLAGGLVLRSRVTLIFRPVWCCAAAPIGMTTNVMPVRRRKATPTADT